MATPRRSARVAVLALGGVAAFAASARAESTRLTILQPTTAPAEVGVRLSAFHGDGFWDSTRTLANQSNTLREARLEIFGVSTLAYGLFAGLDLPLLHREIDQAVPGSRDADNFGFGDAVVRFGWRDERLRWRFRPGAEMLWKTPSGRSNLGLEDVDRGNPAVAPLGTGGHDLDLWGGTTLTAGPFQLATALGYRKRFRTDVVYFYNLSDPSNPLITETRPRERLQLRLGGELDIAGKVGLTAAYESFKELLLLDSRRGSLGQNRAWGGWVDLGLRVPLTGGSVAAIWNLPAIGRSYPDIPPTQFQEREPLLGHRLTVELSWQLDYARDHGALPVAATPTASAATATEATP